MVPLTYQLHGFCLGQLADQMWVGVGLQLLLLQLRALAASARGLYRAASIR
jgi:hypothetical protein